tara:strand:+ start:32276 stop:32491 length:216 start_codon:yes stop_codon:yes gene_type:complete
MLQTKKQVVAALEYIVAETGWSQREISRRSKVHHATVNRYLDLDNPNLPTLSVRQRINRLFLAVKKMENDQ